MPFFQQGLQFHPLPGVARRLGNVISTLMPPDQEPKRFDDLPLQLFARQQLPLFKGRTAVQEESGQEAAPIERHGF